MKYASTRMLTWGVVGTALRYTHNEAGQHHGTIGIVLQRVDSVLNQRIRMQDNAVPLMNQI